MLFKTWHLNHGYNINKSVDIASSFVILVKLQCQNVVYRVSLPSDDGHPQQSDLQGIRSVITQQTVVLRKRMLRLYTVGEELIGAMWSLNRRRRTSRNVRLCLHRFTAPFMTCKRAKFTFLVTHSASPAYLSHFRCTSSSSLILTIVKSEYYW